MASVTFPDGTWWMSGGKKGNIWLNSSMIYGVGRGPELPYPAKTHCTTLVNNTHVMLTGGEPAMNQPTNASYILDWTTREWHQVQTMPVAISFHSCFTLGHATYAVGGSHFLKYSHSSGEWSTLDLGFSISTPETVVVEGRVLMTGILFPKEDRKMYEFDPATEGWDLRMEKLRGSRSNPHTLLAFEE